MALGLVWLQPHVAVGSWVAEPYGGRSGPWAWILLTEEGLRTRTCGGVVCDLVWMLCPPLGSPADGARGEGGSSVSLLSTCHCSGELGGGGEGPKNPARKGGCDLKDMEKAGKDCQEDWHGAESSFASRWASFGAPHPS